MIMPCEKPFAFGSGDGYWVRAEDKQHRPDKEMYNIPLFTHTPAADANWHGKPDCRVCDNSNKRPCHECINGDEFKERPRIQLWRTE